MDYELSDDEKHDLVELIRQDYSISGPAAYAKPIDSTSCIPVLGPRSFRPSVVDVNAYPTANPSRRFKPRGLLRCSAVFRLRRQGEWGGSVWSGQT
jgi:hypothetical protein